MTSTGLMVKETTLETMELSFKDSPVKSGEESNPGQMLKPLLEDPSLPEGWTRTVTQRTEGASAGHWDIYIHGQGKKFRSKPELERYLKEKDITEINIDDIDFTVWGRGVKPPRTPKTPKFGVQTPVKKVKSSVKKTEKEGVENKEDKEEKKWKER